MRIATLSCLDMFEYLGVTNILNVMRWYNQGRETTTVDAGLISTLKTVQMYLRHNYEDEQQTHLINYKTAYDSGRSFSEVTFPLITFTEFDIIRIEYMYSDNGTWCKCQLLKEENTIKEREFENLSERCIMDNVRSLLKTRYWYVFNEAMLSETFKHILKYTKQYLEKNHRYARRDVSLDKTEPGDNILAVSIPLEFAQDFDRIRIVEKKIDPEIIFRFQLFKKEMCLRDELLSDPTQDAVVNVLKLLMEHGPIKSKMIDILNRFDHLILNPT